MSGLRRSIRRRPGPCAAPGPVIEGRAEPARRGAQPPAAGPRESRSGNPWRACVRSIRHSMSRVSWTGRKRRSGSSSAPSPPATGLRCDHCCRTTPIVRFAQAIEAREAAGHVQVSEIRGMETVAIEEAELRGTTRRRDRAVCFRPDQPDARQGRAPCCRNRRCDRNHRSLDVRA